MNSVFVRFRDYGYFGNWSHVNRSLRCVVFKTSYFMIAGGVKVGINGLSYLETWRRISNI